MNDFLSQWLEDNYKYIAMAFCKDKKEQENIAVLADICKKHNVSFKVFMDIFTEFNNEVTKND